MKLVALVTRRGQKQVQKLSLQPQEKLIVGRGWESDIIIDDQYIDAAHVKLSVDEQGKFAVEDLGTRNGTKVGNRKLNGKGILTEDAVIKLGDASLQIINADTEVVPAQKRSAAHNLLRRFNSIGGVFFALLLASVAVLLELYVISPIHASSGKIVQAFIGAGALIFGWSFIVGFIGKLFRGEVNFTSHLVFVSVSFALVSVLVMVLNILTFNINSNLFTSVVHFVFIALMIGLGAYVTISLSTNLTSVKKAALTCALVVLPVGYMLISPSLIEEHENWSNWVELDEWNQPPALVFANPITLEEHMKSTATLFSTLGAQTGFTEAVDRLGLEPPDESPEQMQVLNAE